MIHRFAAVVLIWLIGAGTVLAADPRDILVDQLSSDQIERLGLEGRGLNGADLEGQVGVLPKFSDGRGRRIDGVRFPAHLGELHEETSRSAPDRYR